MNLFESPLSAFKLPWLPSAEGQGVADLLYGDKPFTGKTADWTGHGPINYA